MDKKSDVAKKEEEILAFWKKNKIFEKTLEKDAPSGEYVFYDGPPFATGLPHYGHLLASTIKDAVPRYWTMRGFKVERRWGWDCHGLPIENIVERELGISGKKDIEKIGIETFNKTARGKVLSFAHEWKKTIERIARWVDFDGSYKTMDNSYIESVWWGLSQLHKKKLLYEGQKVLLYCPRCETPVSKAETAMDNSYKEIIEEAVTVKFKVKNPEKHNLPKNTYLLAWTTTPWTLPGNVALAVGKDIPYVLISKNEEHFVLAKDRVQNIFHEEVKIRDVSTRDLLGIEYEPLFDVQAARDSGRRAWYVAHADFVTTEEGTGIVHTAVVYGEDDYRLGQEINLPIIPLLSDTGHFNEKAPSLFRGKYFKESEGIIKEDLEKRNLLFSKEKHAHSYPHCWRCDTQLYYNAVPSWFIDAQKYKRRLLRLNKKIHWIPEHLKEGRFKNNIAQAPDWNISRNRYWASPLPIWKCSACSDIKVLGSFDELFRRNKDLFTKVIFIRHGESEKNTKGVLDSTTDRFPLTGAGKRQAQAAGKSLRKEDIDIVLSSPVRRTRETAEIIGKKLQKKVEILDTLSEIESGSWEELSQDEITKDKERNNYLALPFDEKYKRKRGETGESWEDLDKRMTSFVEKIATNYKGKTVLVVTHQGNIVYGLRSARDLSLEETGVLFAERKCKEYATPFVFYLDGNTKREFDMHRPYIDVVTFPCAACDGTMRRVHEVVDAWVESGSMPFAHIHYPFENKSWFKKHFPAQFITEYISQTRTWFYYTHFLASVLFRKIAFEHVVTTGTVLASDGQKMSKSKGNFPDPHVVIDTYGADALRFYLLSSPVMRAEDLNFSEKNVDEIYKKVILRLRNVLSFYDLYKDKEVLGDTKSDHVLDRWILSRLSQVIHDVEMGMNAYVIDRALTPIDLFVSDLSLWYLRRSRERFKGDDAGDRARALSTLRYILTVLSHVIAPFIPYIAEEIYQSVREDNTQESVHLALWPARGNVDEKLVNRMKRTREIVEEVLSARQKAGIRVRQPLASLTLRDKELVTDADIIPILLDEVNIKEARHDTTISDNVVLDTKLTKELEEEGHVREMIRNIQDRRKKGGFVAQEKIKLLVSGNEETRTLVENNKSDIMRGAGLSDINFSEHIEGDRIVHGPYDYTVQLNK